MTPMTLSIKPIPFISCIWLGKDPTIGTMREKITTEKIKERPGNLYLATTQAAQLEVMTVAKVPPPATRTEVPSI